MNGSFEEDGEEVDPTGEGDLGGVLKGAFFLLLLAILHQIASSFDLKQRNLFEENAKVYYKQLLLLTVTVLLKENNAFQLPSTP